MSQHELLIKKSECKPQGGFATPEITLDLQEIEYSAPKTGASGRLFSNFKFLKDDLSYLMCWNQLLLNPRTRYLFEDAGENWKVSIKIAGLLQGQLVTADSSQVSSIA